MSAESGLRNINEIPVLALDGLWNSLEEVAPEDRLVEALTYAGCEFHDDNRRFVVAPTYSLVALGGIPVATRFESDERVGTRISDSVHSSYVVMGSSANFSYLSNREAQQSYERVVELGHTSVAHTVHVGVIAAGISEAAELELSLQRDLVHISKLTNARTKVQNHPPLLIENEADIPAASEIYDVTTRVADNLRANAGNDKDRIEFINSLFPTRKATILLVSGTLRNLIKLVDFEHDDGKEKEFRDLTVGIKGVLGLLWPELFNDGKGNA